MVAQNITPVKHRIATAMYRHIISNKDIHGFAAVMVVMIAVTAFITQSPLVYIGFPAILVAGVIAGTYYAVQKDKPSTRP